MSYALHHIGRQDAKQVEERLKQEGYDTYLWRDAPGTTYSTHVHPEDEVRYIVEGEIEITIEGEGTLCLRAGDLLYLKGGVPHSARTATGVTYIAGTKRSQHDED